ncbi:MAG: YVTN family beta-propeller repeat protein [Rhodospirillaceae bacterium]|nr:YVTN family beta-propeller repeat protein [Rhodospirillaceae bacterium]MBL6930320.1 YVTN family beta-propeller repeat protein [Rhodospirillales bacterium]
MIKTTFSAFLFLLTFTAAATAQTAYVTNEKDDTLSVIDLTKMEVITTIEVGQRPRGVYLSPDNKTLYLCASDDDTIQEIDVETLKVRHELPSGANPETFAISADGKRIYTSNESDNVVTVIDLENRKLAGQIDVGVEPEGMAVSPDGKIVINTSETTNMAHWIDSDSLEIFDNSLVDQRPRHAEFDSEGKQLWVSAEIGGTVSVFDVKNRQEIAKIPFAIKGIHKDRVQPVGIRLSKNGRYAFIALGPANHIAVVDAKTFEVTKYILVGRRVWHMAFTPDQKKLLTTNGVSGDVTVIDVDDLKAVKSIKVGRFPWGVAIRP